MTMTGPCGYCRGKAYMIVARSDGRKAIERCDACAAHVLSDEQAAILARHDGYDCDEGYPCIVTKEPQE